MIDPATRIGAVHLTISDLDRSVRFYDAHLGFTVHRRDDRTAWLGAGGADRGGGILVRDPARDAIRFATAS